MSDDKKIISFRLVHSNFYRTVHVDGIFGGQTPYGLFAISFFSETVPIPRVVRHEVDGDVLGKEISRDVGQFEDIRREVEFQAIMSADVLESFRDFLDEKLKQLKSSEGKDE